MDRCHSGYTLNRWPMESVVYIVLPSSSTLLVTLGEVDAVRTNIEERPGQITAYVRAMGAPHRATVCVCHSEN